MQQHPLVHGLRVPLHLPSPSRRICSKHIQAIHPGSDPIVKRVCFCLPLPFLPFPDPAVSPSASLSLSLAVACCTVSITALVPQAGFAGVTSPRIFRSETFPFTGGFCFGAFDVGSSGNKAFDNLGGGTLVPEPRPWLFEFGEEMRDVAGIGGGGVRTPDEELDVQGVLRRPWWTTETGTGPGVGRTGGWRGGKTSGGLGRGAMVKEEPAT